MGWACWSAISFFSLIFLISSISFDLIHRKWERERGLCSDTIKQGVLFLLKADADDQRERKSYHCQTNLHHYSFFGSGHPTPLLVSILIVMQDLLHLTLTFPVSQRLLFTIDSIPTRRTNQTTLARVKVEILPFIFLFLMNCCEFLSLWIYYICAKVCSHLPLENRILYA